MDRVLTIVLAGGRGDRLKPLTNDRAKPAVPFGGAYRIIDFALSNCVRSGLRQIMVMTQYKSQSLQRHLRQAWGEFHRDFGEFLEVMPPQQRVVDRWYEGTADAVYQNLYAIEQSGAEHVLILSGDHVYKMDYRDMLLEHHYSGAKCTVACVPQPLSEGSSFGVMKIDGDNQIVEFEEKPGQPSCMPDDPNSCLASMGVYVFQTRYLIEMLLQDGVDDQSQHDFGHNILPQIIRNEQARAYSFRDPTTNLSRYWRDVGTVDAYFEASMDLLKSPAPFELHDPAWRIHSHAVSPLPALLEISEAADAGVFRSIVGAGSRVSNSHVRNTILSALVRVQEGAQIEDSILFDGVNVGRDAQIRRAILDKNIIVPDGTSIGWDHEWDRARGLTVTETGIVVVPKGYRFAEPQRNQLELDVFDIPEHESGVLAHS